MSHLIGLLSDAHGNAPAFRKGVALLKAEGAQSIYFLGDAVGYIPSIEVLEVLIEARGEIECIRGNHEAMLLDGGVEDAKDEIYQLARVRRMMNAAQMDMVAGWPDSLEVWLGAFKLLLVHGSPDDRTYGYVYPDSELSCFDADADVVFMGNTHRPFVREDRGRLYVNVGSCGLPRDAGDLGCAALFDAATGNARILRFDIGAETRDVFARVGGVHGAVLDLAARRQSDFVGERRC